MRLRDWGAFWLLAIVWGTSFLWIKIAVQEIGPFTLVALRLLFGLVGLVVVLIIARQSFPRDRNLWLRFLFMGATNTAIPITLISWGETRIDSSVAAILNGTVPLFTIVIAHYWVHDEKITLPRVFGLVIGFVGVVVLVSRDLNAGSWGDVLGQLAVVLAAISYATAYTFSRRYLRGQSPILQAAAVLMWGDLLMWLAVPLTELPLRLPLLPQTWLAIAWLGLLGSCLAFLLNYYLINAIGPTRASLVAYVFPVIGLALGILLLNEVADWHLLVGSLLVVSGIVIVNLLPTFAVRRT